MNYIFFAAVVLHDVTKYHSFLVVIVDSKVPGTPAFFQSQLSLDFLVVHIGRKPKLTTSKFLLTIFFVFIYRIFRYFSLPGLILLTELSATDQFLTTLNVDQMIVSFSTFTFVLYHAKPIYLLHRLSST